MTTALNIHPFERANLGKAPFRFVGMTEKVYVACPGAPEQPAGTCDYCGTGIRYCCHIRSADGREFVIGTDCVRKTDKASLVNATEFDRAIADQQRKLRAEKRIQIRAREQKRIDAALVLLDRPEIAAAVAAAPHPFRAMAEEGKTYADYIDYMKRYAGNSGMLKVARVLEELAGEWRMST